MLRVVHVFACMRWSIMQGNKPALECSPEVRATTIVALGHGRLSQRPASLIDYLSVHIA